MNLYLDWVLWYDEIFGIDVIQTKYKWNICPWHSIIFCTFYRISHLNSSVSVISSCSVKIKTCTTSAIIVGHIEVTFSVDILSRRTRKQRRTAAWTHGITCGSRRQLLNCSWISGIYFWYWSFSLQKITKANFFSRRAFCSYSCSFDVKMLRLPVGAMERRSV